MSAPGSKARMDPLAGGLCCLCVMDSRVGHLLTSWLGEWQQSPFHAYFIKQGESLAGTLCTFNWHSCFLHYQNDFREYPPLLRHAISVARRLQDPLIEFCKLCNPDEDILAIRYHPLQVSNFHCPGCKTLNIGYCKLF